MDGKKKIIVVGKDITDAMREKIAEFMEKENAEAVYVDSVDDYSHEQLTELIKNKELVIAPDKENKNKKVLIAGHCGFISKTATPIAHISEGADGVTEACIEAGRIPKSFTDVYGEPPPPKPIIIKAQPKIEMPEIIYHDDDIINGTRQKKDRSMAHPYSPTCESKRRKKQRSQKKSRKQNRRRK